jgi:hypothetical protein
MPVFYTFANATTAIPLANLDNNFATPITIGNTAVQLGNTITSVNNLTLANVTVSSGNVAGGIANASITNAQLANNAATIGNTTVTLGATASSLGNVTLNLPTVTNYTETLYTASGNTTINLSNGTVQQITTANTTTITLPSSVSGKSFTVIVNYNGANTIVWAGGSTLKWAGGTTPTPTAASGKIDIFNFYQDGTNTYGAIYGQNF